MNGPGRASGRGGGGELRPPEPQRDPLEFLFRSWSASAADVSREFAAAPPPAGAIAEDISGELDDGASAGTGGTGSGSSFSFASAATSQLIMDRIMSHSQEVSPLTSGRLSHSSGPLNGGGSLSDSPPFSPDVDDSRSGEHAEGAAAPGWQQDGGAVAQGQEGEEEGGDEGAQRAGPRRRHGGGRGRCRRRRSRRHGRVRRQRRPWRAHRHGDGVRGHAGRCTVRGGGGVHGRRSRAPRRRRRLGGQRQDPRRHRHHHGRRRHRVTRRGDAEGEGAEGGVERRRGDPGGEGLHWWNGRSQPRPQSRRPEAADAAAASQGAGDGQQQQQQLQRRPAGARSGREQVPRHLLPRAPRPRHRAPQAHPQRIVALEGCIGVHQPNGRGDAEDEEPACRRDHNQEEEECGGGCVQGPGGVAGAAPAGRGRAPPLLRPADGGAPGDRVRVRKPEGARHVDQGSGAPPRHRRRPQALRMTGAGGGERWWRAAGAACDLIDLTSNVCSCSSCYCFICSDLLCKF